MIITIIILFIMTTSLYVIAFRRGDGSHIRGLKTSKGMIMGYIPLLITAFIVAGLIQIAIPPEIIHSWIGEEAGWKGIVIGSIAGMFIMGGPYVAFPIIAAIFQAGASIGTAVALITGWAIMGVGLIPFEMAMVGLRFTAVRISITFIFPFLTGALAQYIFGGGF